MNAGGEVGVGHLPGAPVLLEFITEKEINFSIFKQVER
jgi:hypothetical protein